MPESSFLNKALYFLNKKPGEDSFWTVYTRQHRGPNIEILGLRWKSGQSSQGANVRWNAYAEIIRS